MINKLEEYEKFFRLLRRDQEKKFEQYALTPLNALFTEGKAFHGRIVGATEHGQLILKFETRFTPRLKVPMVMCVIKPKAFVDYSDQISRWECTSIKFRENADAHTSFSDVLPIYYLSDKMTIGCGQIRLEMFSAVKLALEQHKDLQFVMLESLPPTELLKNLAEYIVNHQSDSNLILKPKKTYDDWKPVELTNKDDIAGEVLKALENHNVCVLQGPPGTGKSYTLGSIISRVTAEKKSVCVTTQSNASLISLVSQETISPLIEKGGPICKTVLSSEEKRKHPFLMPASKELLVPEGGLLCSTYYSLSRIINTTGHPIYDIIVIEEASQAFLTAIAAFMRLGKKCIIVGDPMQLAPVIEIMNDSDYKSIDINTQANGMMTYVLATEVPCYRITTSFRLTPASSNLTRNFYGGNLTSVQKERTLFNVPIEMAPFFPDEGGTILYHTTGSASAHCSREALELMNKIVAVFKAYYPKRRLAILSPFVQTTKMLEKEFCGDDQKLDIMVETVSRIQGETVDYTIYYVPSRNPGFAFSDNLFNVATSRSRSTTLLITDMPIDYIKIDSNKVLNFLNDCKSVNFGDKQETSLDITKFKNNDRDEIKKLYPGLEHIVDELLDNNIEFSFDGDIDLVDPIGEVIATAGLILFNHKLAIDPADNQSQKVFEREGYRTVSSANFTIDLLK